MQTNYLNVLYLVVLIRANFVYSHDEKLKFRECVNYSLDVMENMPIGTFVAHIHIKAPFGSNQRDLIEYSIAEQPKDKFPFRIDNSTGVIRTNRKFNRDEPDNEKSFFVTILTKLASYPWLYDSCRIEFIITDDNDNAPFFHQETYYKMISSNLSVGDKVMQLHAHDIDDDENSTLTYSILNKGQLQWNITNRYFRINENTGWIFLKHAMVEKPWFKFYFVVSATDRGRPPKIGYTNVEIQIASENLKPPSFSDDQYHLWIPEMKIHRNFGFSSITAKSNIKDMPDLSFEMLTGPTEQTNKEHTFTLKSSGQAATIMLSGNVDYERIKIYWLGVRATNMNGIVAEAMITVNIMDVNDNLPIVQNTGPILMEILENEPPGFPVMKIQAIDADVGERYNHVNYRLGSHLEFFTIDEKTGIITTLAMLEKCRTDTIDIKVFASNDLPYAIDSGDSEEKEHTISIHVSKKVKGLSSLEHVLQDDQRTIKM